MGRFHSRLHPQSCLVSLELLRVARKPHEPSDLLHGHRSSKSPAIKPIRVRGTIRLFILLIFSVFPLLYVCSCFPDHFMIFLHRFGHPF